MLASGSAPAAPSIQLPCHQMLAAASLLHRLLPVLTRQPQGADAAPIGTSACAAPEPFPCRRGGGAGGRAGEGDNLACPPRDAAHHVGDHGAAGGGPFLSSSEKRTRTAPSSVIEPFLVVTCPACCCSSCRRS